MKENAHTAANRPAHRINWAEVHRRLDSAQGALEQTATPTEAEKKATLKARAKALALELGTNVTEQVRIEVIEFVVAYEKYAVESSYVREVYPLKELTPLPGTPAFVLGIMNVRGQIVSVIYPKQIF